METLKLKEKYTTLSRFFNEKQRRLYLGIEAKLYGYGGVSHVSRETGVSRRVISQGIKELDSPDLSSEPRIRQSGGGRKRTVEKDLTLKVDLDLLVDPVTRGDPESPLRWTCKSVRKLSEALNSRGHLTSRRLVSDLLHEMGYSLQANRKTDEGKSHPDRDAQFHYINDLVKDYMAREQPVISVDTKKKELVGNYKNNGREWHPHGEPEDVKAYDFVDKELGRVNPYGVYDIARDIGWVNVGIDHDTATFAVESIRRWWQTMGQSTYPNAASLLITADGGGSNGSRVKLWKIELQRLATEIGLTIRVSHFPPGTSKWNKIEHRLFSFISQNWRGKPLTSHEVIINLIGSTTTKTGLEVKCQLDTNFYPKGIKVTEEEMAKLNIKNDEFHGNWNYSISPNFI